MGESGESYLTLCSSLVATYFSQKFLSLFLEGILKDHYKKYWEKKEKGKSFWKEVWKVGTNKKNQAALLPPEIKTNAPKFTVLPVFPCIVCAVKKRPYKF